MKENIKLDGRTFHGITQALTAAQDDYITGHLRLAGSIEVLGDRDGVRRTEKQRAEDLLTNILLSGRKHQILAGCLTEEGKVWNRKTADDNAARFEAITDGAEKTDMRDFIVEFVVYFFSLGEPSLKTSRKSSSRSEKVPPTKNEAPSSSETSTP